MKIRYKKDHLNSKAKDTGEVSKDRGNYLIRTGVAEEVKTKRKKKK